MRQKILIRKYYTVKYYTVAEMLCLNEIKSHSKKKKFTLKTLAEMPHLLQDTSFLYLILMCYNYLLAVDFIPNFMIFNGFVIFF